MGLDFHHVLGMHDMVSETPDLEASGTSARVVCRSLKMDGELNDLGSCDGV
jgi:hypothetical protein